MKYSRQLLAILLITVSTAQLYAKKQQPWIQRLEPTFWWTDMKNPDLQLTIYGQGINTAEFSINYPGISIERKQLTDNPNFVFLYLKIAKETKAGKFNIEIKKGKQKQIQIYELRARRSG